MDKVLLNEINRMAELINHREKKTKIKSENFNVKKILKEQEDDIIDLFDEDEILDTKATRDIPFQLKVAILAHNINKYHADLYNLYTTYSSKTKDIKTGVDGAIRSKKGGLKMSFDEFKELKDLLAKGRYPIPYSEEVETLTPEEQKFKTRWLRKKDYNIISYHPTEGTISDTGKNTLNFLARVLSNQPKDEQEALLFDSPSIETYRNTAKGILLSFYSKALPNVIKSKIHKKNLSVKDEEIIENGIFKAIEAIEDGKYNESRGNVGSFIIEVVKNVFFDYLRKIAPYKLDTSKLYDELESRRISNPQGLIRIKSRLAPSETDTSNVIDVIKIPPSKSYRKGLYEYVYDDIFKAVQDFGSKHTERSIIPVRHLQQHWLPGFEIVKFYSAPRKGGEVETNIDNLLKKTPSYDFVPDTEELIDVMGEKKLKLEETAERRIKALLQYVIDSMQESVALRKDRIKNEIKTLEDRLEGLKGTNSPEENETEEQIQALKLATSFSWGRRDKGITDLLNKKEQEINVAKNSIKNVEKGSQEEKKAMLKIQKLEKDMRILNKTKAFVSRKFYNEFIPKEYSEGKSRKLLTSFLYGLLQSDIQPMKYREQFNAETLKQYKEKQSPEELENKSDEELIQELKDGNLWIPDGADKFASEAKRYLQKFFAEPVPAQPSKFDDLFLVKKFNSAQKKILDRQEMFDIIRTLVKDKVTPGHQDKRFDENKIQLKNLIEEILKKL